MDCFILSLASLLNSAEEFRSESSSPMERANDLKVAICS